MLDYPLNLPGTSAYTLLKIDPEATVEEIREAKHEVIRIRINSQAVSTWYDRSNRVAVESVGSRQHRNR